MDGALSINLFPIRLLSSEPRIYISENEERTRRKTSKAKISGNAEDHGSVVYWAIDEFDGCEPKLLDPETNRALFRDYCNELLFAYFQQSETPSTRSFLNGTEVWIKQGERGADLITNYSTFQIRVLSPRDQHVTPGWTVLVNFTGDRSTHPRSGRLIEIPEQLISTFVLNGRIYKSKKYDAGAIPPEAEVVVDLKVAKFLQVERNVRREINKYLRAYDKIQCFYNRNLKGRKLRNVLHILEAGMCSVSESQIRRTPTDSNLLAFGGGHTHTNAYVGLKEYGPLAEPKSTAYKIFFIFHKDDRDRANKLYQFFNRGLKGYPGLKDFVNVDLNLDRDKTITFANEVAPSAEIEQSLNSMRFEDGITYVAIYLSPISRDETDDERRGEYFKIKEMLLRRNIGSQVIERGNIDKPSFNYFLPNISIALLAKLNGKPWRLSTALKEEMVIGVGAYRQEGSTYLGTTFSFKNDGDFIGFDAVKCAQVEQLGTFFERTIRGFITEMTDIKRVVIHFYKDMNTAEERQLVDALERLDLQVPYVVLTISDERSHEYIVFDESYSGKMPRSGTCVKLRRGEYLLSNNTRYHERTGSRIDDFPFPIKVAVSRANLEYSRDDIVHELIDQIYAFSRMYWRSVKQKAMPVTVIYSNEIARMTANLPHRTVPETNVAKRTLWFL